MRLVDADALMDEANSDGAYGYVDAKQISEAPTIDAVPVVRCEKCVLHGNCVTEDAFALAGIEHPFCCAGKRKEGADNA